MRQSHDFVVRSRAFVKCPLPRRKKETCKQACSLFFSPWLALYSLLSRILLDDCSNTSWSYSTSTLTISDWRIAVCKWWFFVWFVGESPDFPLYPCGFWGFCYHGVITDLSFINDNSLIIKFSYSIPFLLENSYFIKIISSSKFKSTAGNILCI